MAGERVTGPGPRSVQAASDRQLRQTIRDELRRVLAQSDPNEWLDVDELVAALDRLDAADSEEIE